MKLAPGMRFGRLKIASQAASANGRTQWLCECDCGKHHTLSSKDMRRVQSCGCLNSELSRARQVAKAIPFDDRVRRTKTGCLEWLGSTDRGGYGTFRSGKRDHKAHRFSYERAYGPIPAGRLVCHTCDNPPCCEPTHLFLGTAAENSADAVGKGRTARGARNHWSKVNDHIVIQIRRLSSEGRTQQEIAGLFGIDQTTVSKIVLRHSWKHVE